MKILLVSIFLFGGVSPISAAYIRWATNVDMNVSADTVPFRGYNGELGGEAIFRRRKVHDTIHAKGDFSPPELVRWYAGGDVFLRYPNDHEKSFINAWDNKPPRVGLIETTSRHEDIFFEDKYFNNGPDDIAFVLICPVRRQIIKLRVFPHSEGKDSGYFHDPRLDPNLREENNTAQLDKLNIPAMKWRRGIRVFISRNFHDPFLTEEADFLMKLARNSYPPMKLDEQIKKEIEEQTELLKSGIAKWYQANGAVSTGTLSYVWVKGLWPEKWTDNKTSFKAYHKNMYGLIGEISGAVISKSFENDSYFVVYCSTNYGISATAYIEPYLFLGIRGHWHGGIYPELAIINLKTQQFQRQQVATPDYSINSIESKFDQIFLNQKIIIKRPDF